MITPTSTRCRIALVLLAATASAHAAGHKLLPTAELERYQDPPTFVWRTGSSAAMVSQHGAYTSYQVNVDANGNNITLDAANEPSITVDPTDPRKMAVGWRQFNSVNSNFRQAGWAYSSNGGTSWTFPGSLQNNVFRSDPVLGCDAGGQLFYLSLLQTFDDDMWRSVNGGQSWARLASAIGGDKQWFTIDKTNSSGRGFQYQCWSTAGNNSGGRQFTRSTNGGFTWSDPVNIPNSPSWGMLDVDTNGNLFIAGVNLDTNEQWCTRSTNAKNSAQVPSFDLVTALDLGGDIVAGESINPVGIVGQMNVAVDRSGTSANNNVYVLASVQRPGATTGTDVMFIRSSDGGQTFSAPHRINDDPVNHAKWHWFGTLSAAANGRLDAVWLDTRNAANNTDSQLFYSYSMDAGKSWSANVAVSDAFDPVVGYPQQNKMGDYISMVSDNGGGHVAYTATFNGEEDIYYVHVAPRPQLLNISSRARVLTDENVLVGGFIVTGTAPKKFVIRGLGPSLHQVIDPLGNPTLELHDASGTIATNDDWKMKPDGTSQQAEIEATGIPPTNDFESALVVTLNPGAYSAILSGKDRGTGVGVVEVYDLTSAVNATVANISTRAFVETDENVLIGGFIVAPGEGASRVVIRALGPSLSQAGVSGPLPNPTLELHDGNGALLAANDNWKETQQAEIAATGLAPSNDFESAILRSLAPGNYTAVVAGKDHGTGVGAVEVYNLR